MKTMRIILAGNGQPLYKIIPALNELSHIEFVALISDSKDSLSIGQKKLFVPWEGVTEEKIKALDPDWLFQFNSNYRFTPEILQLFSCGAMNAHPGLLPEYAGYFPYQWALRNGEKATGSTLYWMTGEGDAGAIALQERIPITDQDTGLSLYSKVSNGAVRITLHALNLISLGEKLPIVPQDKFKRRIYSKHDAGASEIDWSLSALKVFNFIRAGNFVPFSSPNYVAKTHFWQEPFQVYGSRLGGRALGQAGMVSSLKDGIHIVCGDGFTVILSPHTPAPPLKIGDILG